MSLMPCPEKSCQKTVSTTALTCPSCGANIQQFLKTELCERAVGFPIAPIDYWSSHFWYYSGCQPVSVDLASPGWIKVDEPIATLRYRVGGNTRECIVKSPTDGLVLRKVHLSKMPEIGYGHSNGNQDFIVVLPWKQHVYPEKGSPFEPVGWCNWIGFGSLIEAIHYSAAGGGRLLDAAFDRGFRKLDPKEFFKTKEDLLKAADDLQAVCAIWLPDWDFGSNAYEFGD